ncbi:acetaldehyde dehydrogenase (acetylating) [Paenibacillus sp. FSL R7-0331]|uniref:acetaldehyde dehydrogenase (acetylating) n=1 Tax=Paenibacillus sp. FSL R7-0331 TaxID=1536773 RepID=UPI0004F7C33D|nr:acetaldehyde dehydrogenase (acetylating) [Paenibacillus sp. FSL R7-0331]AIQ55087.1 acetaldehyde dehydrogenase [Paenibacillus sp. FSL R7-0331]
MKRFEKIKVAIIGSGNIGTDLLMKVHRSPYLECSYFIGRNEMSEGMKKAKSLGVRTSANSIDTIINDPDCCDIVFDATSAIDHIKHAPILEELGKFVIDMTPSNIGEMCIPAVNLEECLKTTNINMVTCGGQASIPLAYAIRQTQEDVEYIEVVSSIASKSAGPATRKNIDEYISATEVGIQRFSDVYRTKTILNLNPADPCIDMQVTVFALVKTPNLESLVEAVNEIVRKIQYYVPGYELIIPPTIENERIVIMVRVRGLGDYLPAYAGNLDIINCAAVAAAEEYAKKKYDIQEGAGFAAYYN